MERLIFVCPTTGRDVDVGIETDIGTLLRIRENTLRTRCAVCGERHEWKVCDAALPQESLISA